MCHSRKPDLCCLLLQEGHSLGLTGEGLLHRALSLCRSGTSAKSVWSSLQEGRLPGHIEEVKQHRLEKGEGRAAELSNLLADRSALMISNHCCMVALLSGKVPRVAIATVRCQASTQQLLWCVCC